MARSFTLYGSKMATHTHSSLEAIENPNPRCARALQEQDCKRNIAGEATIVASVREIIYTRRHTRAGQKSACR